MVSFKSRIYFLYNDSVKMNDAFQIQQFKVCRGMRVKIKF